MSPRGACAGAAEPAATAALRRSPGPGARAELPDRLEHPRRDRARGRAGRRATPCSRSAAASGVLSEYLAERVAHVHVVEVDERLREALEDALAGRGNVSLQWADAMRLDLGALAPAAGQAGREPPLRDRRGLHPALDRGAPGRGAVGRDGPAGGRRAARGQTPAAARTGCRRCSPSWPARCKRRASDPAQRLLPRAERRLGAPDG